MNLFEVARRKHNYIKNLIAHQYCFLALQPFLQQLGVEPSERVAPLSIIKNRLKPPVHHGNMVPRCSMGLQLGPHYAERCETLEREIQKTAAWLSGMHENNCLGISDKISVLI